METKCITCGKTFVTWYSQVTRDFSNRCWECLIEELKQIKNALKAQMLKKE